MTSSIMAFDYAPTMSEESKLIRSGRSPAKLFKYNNRLAMEDELKARRSSAKKKVQNSAMKIEKVDRESTIKKISPRNSGRKAGILLLPRYS